MPASRRPRATTIAPSSWPSSPGLAIRTLSVFITRISDCRLSPFKGFGLALLVLCHLGISLVQTVHRLGRLLLHGVPLLLDVLNPAGGKLSNGRHHRSMLLNGRITLPLTSYQRMWEPINGLQAAGASANPFPNPLIVRHSAAIQPVSSLRFPPGENEPSLGRHVTFAMACIPRTPPVAPRRSRLPSRTPSPLPGWAAQCSGPCRLSSAAPPVSHPPDTHGLGGCPLPPSASSVARHAFSRPPGSL